MGKLTIRSKIRSLHTKLTQERREAAARGIFAKIETTREFSDSNYIAIYHALADEIPTIQMIERCCSMGKIVLLPRVDGEQMEFYPIDKAKLSVGSFGIIEPQGVEPIDPQQIDMMIVPGVAFCSDGRRLGRGKGYYDRYLARCPETLYKIGICFGYQLIDNIPCESYDIAMDLLISEPPSDL